MIQPLWESLAVSYTTNMFLLYYPAIAVLSIYPREMRTYVHRKKNCTQMFIVALFHNSPKLETTQMSFSG